MYLSCTVQRPSSGASSTFAVPMIASERRKPPFWNTSTFAEWRFRKRWNDFSFGLMGTCGVRREQCYYIPAAKPHQTSHRSMA